MRLFKVELVVMPLFVLVLVLSYLQWWSLSLGLGIVLLVLMMMSTLRFVAYLKLFTQAPLKKRLKLMVLSVSLGYALLLYVGFVLLYQVMLTLILG